MLNKHLKYNSCSLPSFPPKTKTKPCPYPVFSVSMDCITIHTDRGEIQKSSLYHPLPHLPSAIITKCSERGPTSLSKRFPSSITQTSSKHSTLTNITDCLESTSVAVSKYFALHLSWPPSKLFSELQQVSFSKSKSCLALPPPPPHTGLRINILK